MFSLSTFIINVTVSEYIEIAAVSTGTESVRKRRQEIIIVSCLQKCIVYQKNHPHSGNHYVRVFIIRK